MARGNLAYDENIYSYGYNTVIDTERKSNIRIKSVKKTAPKEAVKAVPKTKRKAKKTNFALVMLVAIAFMVLCRGVAITEKTDLLERKHKELEAILAANEKTQIEIDSALNLKNVEDKAVNELNMARPEKHQTVYIKIDQQDVVEKTEKTNNASHAIGFFGTLKAYLD